MIKKKVISRGFIYRIEYVNREQFNCNLDELNICSIIKAHQFNILRGDNIIITQDFDKFFDGIKWAFKQRLSLLFK